jgi:hypothetical protein
MPVTPKANPNNLMSMRPMLAPLLFVLAAMSSVHAAHHQQVNREDENKKDEEGRVARKAQHREQEKQQQRQETRKHHPQAVALHSVPPGIMSGESLSRPGR